MIIVVVVVIVEVVVAIVEAVVVPINVMAGVNAPNKPIWVSDIPRLR